MDRHRNRTAAVDHPGPDEDCGRRHANAWPGLSDDAVHSRLPVPFLRGDVADGEAVSKCGLKRPHFFLGFRFFFIVFWPERISAREFWNPYSGKSVGTS